MEASVCEEYFHVNDTWLGKIPVQILDLSSSDWHFPSLKLQSRFSLATWRQQERVVNHPFRVVLNLHTDAHIHWFRTNTSVVWFVCRLVMVMVWPPGKIKSNIHWAFGLYQLLKVVPTYLVAKYFSDPPPPDIYLPALPKKAVRFLEFFCW